MNIKEIFLMGLSEPDYSRIEYWKKLQKESGFSEIIFLRKLIDCSKSFNEVIESNINKHIYWGNDILDFKLPLYPETNGKLNGHFGKNELIILNESIGKWLNEIKNNVNNIGNIRVEFIKTYNQEVTTERKEKLQNDLSKIESIEDKITFLENEKIIYLQNLQPEILDVSGRTDYPNFDKGKALLWDRYLELEIEKQKKLLIPQQIETKSKIIAPLIEFKPSMFRELFINPEIVNDCITLLKETDKPCINDLNEFVRNKGAFIVWFNALEQKKIFNCSFANDTERAKTLNHNFKNLNVSISLFRQENKRATEKYKKHFENEITAIKN